MNWCSIFFVANMVNINLGMEVLNISILVWIQLNHICHPFYRMPPKHWRHRLEVEYSNKDQLIPTLFAIVLVWIATKQTIGTNFKMSCLVIVTKRCHVIGTPPFPSADCKYTLEFWSSRYQPNCWFHIVLSSKQWRQFINCTVYDVRVAITYARKYNNIYFL